MVKHNNKKQIFAWVSSSTWVLCGMLALPAHAGEFYTIIGPDGRPMVIPRAPSETKQVETKTQLEPQQVEKIEFRLSQTKQTPPIQTATTVAKAQISQPQTAVTVKEETVTKPKPQLVKRKPSIVHQQSKFVENVQTVTVENPDKLKTQVESSVAVSVQPVETPEQASPVPVIQTNSQEISSSAPAKDPTLGNKNIQKTTTAKQVDRALHKIEANTAIEKATRLASPPMAVPVSSKSTSDGFLEINGDRYVKNEYLEGQEFNLENKKRFYVMPEGVVDKELGAPRLQVVEREKGVNQGVLDRLFKSTQHAENKVITLSTQYYPIAKDQVVQSLGQACYSDKKVKKAKVLKAQQDVNVWPRQPLQDQFDYEVVAVQAGIKNVQLSSYASSQDQPSFYWPFVAFLDESGCVIEGVTGFKNQNREENKYRYAVMDGMLQLPTQTRYILMTPLLSAVDVEDQILSNQGQIKLTAIR
ncbi:putative pilus assembly protein FilE [Acinetobacter zhairhuonensis]|uniref:putative pilus assembly protein FilE n=1 Tax=Acinetobacter sp. A7.4 TaxID=2919921 RepID=UPI001F4FFFA6|nr:putative pilus assembly protein FilE [Acinetobacter sp. A7.4]MCJ8163041.1 putative pilus assembly protein FilE [Acinetobacter sp. A7.4]